MDYDCASVRDEPLLAPLRARPTCSRFEIKTIGGFNSGVQDAPAAQAQGKAGPTSQPTPDALPKLHGPVLLINGHELDFMMPQSAATFDLINNLPVFYGARHNAGHTATVFHPGGGEFANVASNWLELTLKGDKKAGAMFVGKKCALCTDSNWDVKSNRSSNENSNRSCGHRRMCGRGCSGAESVVVASSRQQHA
jgi:hypothetical protein